jgi:hypothetical protein
MGRRANRPGERVVPAARALYAATGVDIPEADYPRLTTLDAWVDYLDASVRTGTPLREHRQAPLADDHGIAG